MRSKKIFRQLCGRYTIIILTCLPILLLAVTGIKSEEVSVKRFIGREGETLSITSKRMTLKNKENIILFEGDVVVESDMMILKAAKVEVMFVPSSESEQGLMETIDAKKKLSTITATGDVELLQGERKIFARKVVYYKEDEKMILTGSPNIREGKDEIRGDTITVYIAEDRVVVEGGEAVIHPR